MKSTLTFLTLCFATLTAFAQDSTLQLNYNNANASISNTGSFFTNPGGTNVSGYEIPQGGGVHTMHTSQFWFGAKDVNGTLYTSLGGNSQGTDIDRGPYSTNNSYADPSYDDAFMISLCQEEIDNFILWWECANGLATTGCSEVTQPSSEVLNSIYNWPAHGDLSLGQEYYLAPFYDRDGDGTYDPISQGDYPLIKGCCATYMIQNDGGSPHTFSGTPPIGIEMHYLFYQFGANSDLYNTTFVDVMVINKSTMNYPEFACNFMADSDIGYALDDYFGSDSLTNTMIFYNADNLDEGQYLSNPPAIGITALEQPSTSIMSYGFFPSAPSETWNLMNGLQPNGLPLLDPNGSPTKFLVHGDPNDASAWNETSAGYVAGDRRGLNTTKIQSFNSGDTLLQTYAIVYSEGGNHLENASNVINLASWAKTFYDTEINDGCDAGGFASTPELESTEIAIYPNPNNGLFTIESASLPLLSVQLFDLSGKQIDFSSETNGSNMKIQVGDQASGVYLIHIETEQGVHVERMIIH